MCESPLVSVDADPRWDTAGFRSWCEDAALRWVKARYLRELVASGLILARCQDLPDGSFCLGIPPDGVQLYAVSSTWLGFSDHFHQDPNGFHLKKVVKVLNDEKASDEDLVFIYYTARPQRPMIDEPHYPCSVSLEQSGRICKINYSDDDERCIPVSSMQNSKDSWFVRVAKVTAESVVTPSSKDLLSWYDLCCCSLVHSVAKHLDLKSLCSLRMVGSSVLRSVAAHAGKLEARKGYTSEELRCNAKYEEKSYYIVTYFLLKQIMCTELPLDDAATPYYQRAWACGFDFHLSSFAQRIVNLKDPSVKESMTPEFLCSIHPRLKSRLLCGWEEDVQIILALKSKLWNLMPSASCDAVGFQAVCRTAGFRWVKVWFIHELAKRLGPAPRCQDLPDGTFIVGEVPPDCQPFVLSYSWSASQHFAPSGTKVKEFSDALRSFNALDDDVCFLDYMSLWQGGGDVPAFYAECNALPYQTSNGRVSLAERTPEQQAQFAFALFETTRLYAFAGGLLANGLEVRGCKVIVLPIREDIHSFPAGGSIVRKWNEFANAEQEHCNWGFQKPEPYERGGWTCAEFAVAYKSGTIANLKHPDVQKVLQSRHWPENVQQYADMMDKRTSNSVSFTKKGDREAVRFNFYKFTSRIDDEMAEGST